MDRVRINNKEEKLIKDISKVNRSKSRDDINQFINFLKSKETESRISKKFLETKIEYWEDRISS